MATGSTTEASTADQRALVDEILREGSKAWPMVHVSEPAARAYCQARFDADGSPVTHPADFYLAMACALETEGAVEAFETTLLPDMVRSASHLFTTSLRADEVRQMLRAKLFVAEADEVAKIAQYTGRGPLGGWLRVVAVRTVLSEKRKKSLSSTNDEVLLGLASPHDDPEVEHLRARYTEEFKTAFYEVLAELDIEDRNLLRLHMVDGLSIDELAPVFQIHRATAARRLVKARDEIASRTRTLLLSRLQLTESECTSIMGLILSQLDVSIVRVLSVNEA